MRAKWVLLVLASVAALTILAACGSGDGDSDVTNPGGITAEEAGVRVKALLDENGCDKPFVFTTIEAEGDKWILSASIGLSGFSWTYDPVANTVVEASGKCTSSK